jgi:hypothetical protein
MGENEYHRIVDNNVKFDEDEEGIRVKFKPYSELIQNLTDSFCINTERSTSDADHIQACELSKDSSLVIVILKRSDEHYMVRTINSTTFSVSLNVDLKGDYIKAANIQ